jgi:hypothetical protein
MEGDPFHDPKELTTSINRSDNSRLVQATLADIWWRGMCGLGGGCGNEIARQADWGRQEPDTNSTFICFGVYPDVGVDPDIGVDPSIGV